MELIKSYITQLFKSSSKRLRLSNSDKDHLLNSILTKLENCSDIFPELKQMERVLGLEEVAKKLLDIYKKFNTSYIDFERISIQYLDDRDSLTASLRRFVLSSDVKKNVNKNVKRTKYVFDDTTSTFYEIKDEFEVEKDNDEELITHNKIDVSEFLKDAKEEPKPIENVELQAVEQLTTQKLEEINLESEIKINEISEKVNEKVFEPSTEDKIELKFDIEEIEKSLMGENIPNEVNHKITDHEKTEEDLKIKDDIVQKIQIKEKPKKEDLTPNLFESEAKKEETIIEKKEIQKDQFLEFENDLLENIKLVDEYLFKFLSRLINPEFENNVLTEAERLNNIANELGHDMISKLIKTYWSALLAIKEKKLAATKNEAEIIRSTLIIIVALVKNKDIDLTPYWTNHKLLLNKLQDISYEV